MKTSFEIKATFSVSPSTLYEAWLDSEQHTAMTGGGAECSPVPGGPFTAWDGYINGTNVSLKEHEEIVQKWRTVEFSADAEDSDLILRIQAADGGCELTLIHNNIPEGQPDYEQGWIDNYFTPMRSYFESTTNA